MSYEVRFLYYSGNRNKSGGRYFISVCVFD